MSFSLYEAVIPSYRQILGALEQVLHKAEIFCEEHDIPHTAMIDARLAPDMHPLGYQVKSCAVHSIGSIEGARAGSFSPDRNAWPTDFAGLRGVLQGADARLATLDREAVDALAGVDVEFTNGERRLPFTGANFFLSFSQPNFYFHATTAYAILRAQGLAIGKRDFLGVPRLKLP
ncbi:DUF1993 domain-containing protein [Croceibacterium ferulae]|uniref:DUF1993 domain-containing protein n=1 Tax=Croceibacterium ferulae TaxID=1854641 RepID=UPI000EB2038B|nr:DUF1993 domain-containing protein [Croceibacterium ferulae]